MANQKISVGQKAALAKNTVSYEAGQVVFKEGDTSTELYLMLTGKVAVVKGDQVNAEIDQPMTYFGEMGAILNEPRTATIQTIDKSEFKARDA
ncbi:MAG: cyclic nucleotide-binding domain-containing protein, partial [Planctomycetes bacterium]|nr:cyclic nucleotide-binding domain-containing protein [Planctomycetota bacterium]